MTPYAVTLHDVTLTGVTERPRFARHGASSRLVDGRGLLHGGRVSVGEPGVSSAANSAAYVKRQKAAGLCIRCPAQAAEGRGGLCSGHADQENARHRAKTRERRAEYAAVHMRVTFCHSCGAQRADGRCPFCEG